jgi:hypothetical protein
LDNTTLPADDLWDSTRLSGAILNAIDRVLEDRERADGSLEHLARQCDKLAHRIVDQAVTSAFDTLFKKLGFVTDAASLTPLIALRTFVRDVGPNKFETHFFRALMALASENPTGTDNFEMRLQIFGLLKTIGHPISATQLEQEHDIRRRNPLGWLDLAINQFSPDRIVAAISYLLVDDLVDAKGLLPYVPVIMKNYGAGTVQAMLDQCCMHLYEQRRYSEAEELVEDFELIEPQGWQQPLGVIDLTAPRNSSPLEFTENIMERVSAGQAEPVSALIQIRKIYDPVLATAELADEQGAPEKIIRRLQASDAKLTYFVAAHLDELRRDDDQGADWYQDSPAWKDVSFPKSDFKREARKLRRKLAKQGDQGVARGPHKTLNLQRFAEELGF